MMDTLCRLVRQVASQATSLVAAFVILANVEENGWSVFADPTILGPFPDGVPGSGYGCDNPCDYGEVKYVIRAKLNTYEIAGSRNAPGFVTTDPGNVDVSTFTRTFEGDASLSSPFCYDDDGTSGPLNPCLTVEPGQTMTIQVINEMDDGMELLNQELTTLEIMNSYGYNFTTPNFAQTNVENTPGLDVTYDETNIHLHGMQVVPHLFYPQGTADVDSDWITITPSNKLDGNQTCFCYVFEVPHDHPQGAFFWHIHRHGSASMQSWAGMAGLLEVGNINSTGSPAYDLKEQGITRHQPLVLWEWASSRGSTMTSDPNTYIEGTFSANLEPELTIMTFMANNEYQPTFDMMVNETLHVPLLCAQTTTGSALYIMNESGTVFPFWVFAADGISYEKAFEKEMIVIGPGQREALLLQFPRPGRYSIVQYIINDPFNFTNAAETPVAYFQVMDDTEPVGDAVDMESLSFTPGMAGQDINASEIGHQVGLAFNVNLSRSEYLVPFPVFTIDGELFDRDATQNSMEALSAAEWTMSSELGFHPFHIHVNPFQVKDVQYNDSINTTVGGMSLQDAVIDTLTDPPNMWRDTAFIPDLGSIRTYQRFTGKDIAWAGKSVYHCHFLDHEDQGMMGVMMITRSAPLLNDTTTGFPSVAPVASLPTDDEPTAGPTAAPSSPASSCLEKTEFNGLAGLSIVLCALFSMLL